MRFDDYRPYEYEYFGLNLNITEIADNHNNPTNFVPVVTKTLAVSPGVFKVLATVQWGMSSVKRPGYINLKVNGVVRSRIVLESKDKRNLNQSQLVAIIQEDDEIVVELEAVVGQGNGANPVMSIDDILIEIAKIGD